MKKQFNPQPGDKIICNNGEEFICCTQEYLMEWFNGAGKYSTKPIFGFTGGYGWQDWNQDGTVTSDNTNYFIREVIPQQKYEAPSKAEPMYSAEDIRKACIDDLGWMEYSYELLMESLEKVKNPEYMEYLRLKAMFESEQQEL